MATNATKVWVLSVNGSDALYSTNDSTPDGMEGKSGDVPSAICHWSELK